MASSDAIATALGTLAEAFPTREVTKVTASVWAKIFAKVPDDVLGRATLRLCRDPQRRFFPTSGEVFDAIGQESKPVDSVAILHRIQKLGYYDAAFGWVDPTQAKVREVLGDAIADSYMVAGQGPGVFSDNDTTRDIARRSFTDTLNEAQRRQPAVPVLPQLMAPKEPDLVPESWSERKPLLPPKSAKKPALEYLMQSTLEKIVARVEVVEPEAEATE